MTDFYKMTDADRKKAAKEFANSWTGHGYEKGESQMFWMMLLTEVFGVNVVDLPNYILFENKVHIDNTAFIDAFIPSTKVLIEQKSETKDLNAPIRQSDGSLLTPFTQAKRYSAELPYSQRPRWIVTCNFREFYVYDMERPGGDPEIIKLADLGKEYYRLNFLVEGGQEAHIKREFEVSIKAGELVGLLYDAFLKQYRNPESEDSLRSLNKLCVRIVFCLYAEDAGIFGKKDMFHDYMSQFSAKDSRRALIDLFHVLDQKEADRDPYLDERLAAFPYVNGNLFADEDIEIPHFTDEIRDILLSKASDGFDWSDISPTIFGAVFESTLNPETRRSGGMHYTSIENIHKIIDPLFLDDLKTELAHIEDITTWRTQQAKLEAFQDKLASLRFLDPACGSGNFLTETYICIRRLENRVIELLAKGRSAEGQMILGVVNPIQCSIGQFYGIEINDFAVSVAKTALWIAESQMLEETKDIIHMDLDFLPLTTNASIVEGNALRMNWNDVVDKSCLSYIMGNPPFVGYSLQSPEQKNDMLGIYVDESGKPYNTAGKIDYVAAWYFKAAQMIQHTPIRVAFVSTNSITQGEQVPAAWMPLFSRFGVHIDFAHRTFRWDSEASLKAHVHCVIIGLSCLPSAKKKVLFESGRQVYVDNINPYLISGPNVFVTTRTAPLCDVPELVKGSSPVDGGHLLLEDEEKRELEKKEPGAAKYIRRFLGAREYLHDLPRWCLWVDGISPAELNGLPLVKEHIKATRDFRLSSSKAATRKYADYPMRFMEMRQPKTNYILIPRHSSETRRYIPFGSMGPDVICGDANSMLPNASLYHFGVLTSNVHMAWTRTVCGRIKSDYRYSNDVVYNNFPWPEPTPEQKARIEQTAQAILDVRAKYPDSSLADLYDDLVMPADLRKAHQDNDRAVMAAYGFSVKETTEASCVAALMQLYQKLSSGK